MRILYVDDDINSHKLTDINFRGVSPYVVICAESMPKALDVLSEENFDIVVTDISMPLYSGIDLAKTLSKSHPEIPIYLCTAVPDLLRFEEYKGLGNIKGFIRKPLTPKTLEAKLTGEDDGQRRMEGL
jgi:CheY-like chemotaxis protein